MSKVQVLETQSINAGRRVRTELSITLQISLNTESQELRSRIGFNERGIVHISYFGIKK